MTTLNKLFLLNVLNLIVQSTLVTSAVFNNSTSNNKPRNLQDTNPIVEKVLGLFSYEIIHSYNFVLYSANSTGNDFIKYGARKNSIYDNTSVTIALKSGANERFENILKSCIQNEHTVDVLIIQPGIKDHAELILSKISWFYKDHRSKSSTAYFFITWPWTDDASSDHIQSNSEILNILKTSVPQAPMNSHLYVLLPCTMEEQNDTLWAIWEFYYVYGEYVFELVKSDSDFFEVIKRRQDFRGATLKALVERDQALPVLTVFKEANRTEVVEGAITHKLLEPISKSLNFKLERVQGKGWIKPDTNGQLTGMGKQLLSYEGDFSHSISEMLEFRIEQLHASHPMDTMNVHAYFRQPPPSLYRDFFIEAFQPELWAVLVATWLLIVGSLIAISLVKKRYSGNSCSESDEMIGKEAISWAIGIACQQGWHYGPSSVSLQITFFCGLFASLVYCTAYSASIISIFSVEFNRFNCLNDLLNYGFKLYGNTESWTGQHSVKKQAMEDGVSFNSRLISTTAGLEKIKTSRVAYIMNQELFFPIAIRENNSYRDFCSFLSTAKKVVDKQFMVLYFRKFSGAKKFINLQFTHWKETGLLHHWNVETSRMLPPSCEPKKKEPLPLEIQDVRSAFVILTLGFILCLCFLIFEIISSRRKFGHQILRHIWTDKNENKKDVEDQEDEAKH